MKRKRITALLVLLLVVLGAAAFGAYRSLNNLKNAASMEYEEDSSGFSIRAGISAREDAAENLLKITEKYQENSTEIASLMYELERAVHILKNATGNHEIAEENKKLDAPAQALMAFMQEDTAVTETDLRYLSGQLAELSAQQDKINRSSYHEKAEAFNVQLNTFPGSLFKSLGLIAALPDYRQ